MCNSYLPKRTTALSCATNKDNKCVPLLRPLRPQYNPCFKDGTSATFLPGPLQTRPSRCSSDSRDYRDNAALATESTSSLIVDRPTRHSVNDGVLRAPSKIKNNPQSKHISFSETSFLHYYQSDAKYKKSASYSAKDREKLTRDTIVDVRRIKILAEHYAPPELSGSKAIRFLIESDIILQEEIVGIEHLLIDDMAVRIQRERERHSESCLAEYQQLKLERKEGSVDWERLARVSNLRSGKAARRARIRAALAA